MADFDEKVSVEWPRHLIIGLLVFWSFSNVSLAEQKVRAVIASQWTCKLEHELHQIFSDKLTYHSSADEIAVAYAAILKHKPDKVVPQVESRRLISRTDWKTARYSYRKAPWNFYGENTIQEYFNALEYVDHHTENLPINDDLLKQIHGIATETMMFSGYEERRIRLLFSEGKITEVEMKQQLKVLHQGYSAEVNQKYLGDHQMLRGQFRKDPIDEIPIWGPHYDMTSTRYFSADEVEALKKNPYMTGTELVEKTPGKFYGKAHYSKLNKVEQWTKDVIQETNEKLHHAKTGDDVIRIVTEMEHQLISIHPFIDGNGRSVRLLGDLILKRHGLPPSLHPNENDLFTPIEQAVALKKAAMVDYVNEWHSYLKGSRK